MAEGKHWTENFRVFTPILVTIACFMLGNLIATTNKIDDKLFKHLTNAEIHVLRGTVVEKSEFDLYQKMRDKQMDSMESMVRDIRNIIKDAK